jgi:O-acetyl-ADP-ribose deacetylase (regulator of RNase III)
MRVSIFAGDIVDAEAEAVCTSTNPRLSLVMGTGASVRDRGGFEILRACETIVKNGPASPGSAYATTAGSLPHRVAIHCVASDLAHHSSAKLIRECVRSALACAERAACSSVAMPIFGSGHAHVPFDRAVVAIAEVLRDAATSVRQVILVVRDHDGATAARAIVESILGVPVPISRSGQQTESMAAWWRDGDGC